MFYAIPCPTATQSYPLTEPHSREVRTARQAAAPDATDNLVSGLRAAEKGLADHPTRVVDLKTALAVKGIGPNIGKVGYCVLVAICCPGPCSPEIVLLPHCRLRSITCLLHTLPRPWMLGRLRLWRRPWRVPRLRDKLHPRQALYPCNDTWCPTFLTQSTYIFLIHGTYH